MAYEWGLRQSPNPVVVIGQIARSVANQLDSLLEEVERHDDHEELAITRFTGEHVFYLAFLDSQGTAIGCVRIDKREPPPL